MVKVRLPVVFRILISSEQTSLLGRHIEKVFKSSAMLWWKRGSIDFIVCDHCWLDWSSIIPSIQKVLRSLNWLSRRFLDVIIPSKQQIFFFYFLNQKSLIIRAISKIIHRKLLSKLQTEITKILLLLFQYYFLRVQLEIDSRITQMRVAKQRRFEMNWEKLIK